MSRPSHQSSSKLRTVFLPLLARLRCLTQTERKHPYYYPISIYKTLPLSSRGGPDRRRPVDTALFGVSTSFELSSVHGAIDMFSGCGEALKAIGGGAEMTRDDMKVLSSAKPRFWSLPFQEQEGDQGDEYIGLRRVRQKHRLLLLLFRINRSLKHDELERIRSIHNTSDWGPIIVAIGCIHGVIQQPADFSGQDDNAVQWDRRRRRHCQSIRPLVFSVATEFLSVLSIESSGFPKKTNSF